MVEVSDLNLLQVNLFRRVDYLRDTVEYTVSMLPYVVFKPFVISYVSVLALITTLKVS